MWLGLEISNMLHEHYCHMRYTSSSLTFFLSLQSSQLLLTFCEFNIIECWEAWFTCNSTRTSSPNRHCRWKQGTRSMNNKLQRKQYSLISYSFWFARILISLCKRKRKNIIGGQVVELSIGMSDFSLHSLNIPK